MRGHSLRESLLRESLLRGPLLQALLLEPLLLEPLLSGLPPSEPLLSGLPRQNLDCFFRPRVFLPPGRNLQLSLNLISAAVSK